MIFHMLMEMCFVGMPSSGSQDANTLLLLLDPHGSTSSAVPEGSHNSRQKARTCLYMSSVGCWAMEEAFCLVSWHCSAGRRKGFCCHRGAGSVDRLMLWLTEPESCDTAQTRPVSTSRSKCGWQGERAQILASPWCSFL